MSPFRGCLFSVRLGRDNRRGELAMLRRLLITASLAAALAAAAAPVRAEVAVAPFDGSLQRLAEILGALHYLRNLCGANEGLKWRNEMQAIMDAEHEGFEMAIVERNRDLAVTRKILETLSIGWQPIVLLANDAGAVSDPIKSKVSLSSWSIQDIRETIRKVLPRSRIDHVKIDADVQILYSGEEYLGAERQDIK